MRIEVDGQRAGGRADRAVTGGIGWASAGWSRTGSQRALEGSVRTVSAWDGDELVGVRAARRGRRLVAYVSFVVIHPRWQDRGLGRASWTCCLDDREEDKFILEARTGAEPFYERLGFETISWAMVKRRHPTSRT